MLGISSRSRSSRSQGSSRLNRMAVSKVAPPHISREKSCGSQLGRGLGDLQHVVGAHARRKQRLVRIAKRRVGDEEPLLLLDPPGEALWALARSSRSLGPLGIGHLYESAGTAGSRSSLLSTCLNVGRAG